MNINLAQSTQDVLYPKESISRECKIKYITVMYEQLWEVFSFKKS